MDCKDTNANPVRSCTLHGYIPIQIRDDTFTLSSYICVHCTLLILLDLFEPYAWGSCDASCPVSVSLAVLLRLRISRLLRQLFLPLSKLRNR